MSKHRVLEKQERATLIESISAQIKDLDAQQIDDIFKVAKARVAFLAVERTEAPKLEFSY